MKNNSLKFNENGKFRILQISDLQDTKATSVDTLHFLEAALPALKPDLIVLTGDQLDVVGMWGKGEKLKKNVRQGLLGVLAPIKASGIPFLVTFGNHDCQTGVSNDEQAKVYAEIPNCICFPSEDDGRPDIGTFNAAVKSSDGTRDAMNVYVVDSNSANPEYASGYDNVHPEQIEWLNKKSKELAAANGGKKVPSILFQHIPVPEIYELLKEVPSGTKGAKAAYRARKGKFFALDESKCFQTGTFGESPSDPDVNSGEFESIKNQGDVFAMYFGHDHYNSFAGKVDGIDLGYCPGAGYNTYGLNPRGMRVFDFDENDPAAYKTEVVRVDDFYTPHLYEPIKNFIYINAPESVHAAIPFIFKCLGIIALVVGLSIGARYLLGVRAVAAAWIVIGAAALIYAVYSLTRNKIERGRILKKYK